MTPEIRKVLTDLIARIEETDNVGDYGISSDDPCVNAARELLGEPYTPEPIEPAFRHLIIDESAYAASIANTGKYLMDSAKAIAKEYELKGE